MVARQSKTDKTKLDGYGIQARLYLPADKTKYYFIYAHLSEAKTGRIERSEIVGKVGRTGNLSCDQAKTHLHFEVKDPADWDITVDPASVSTVFQWTQEP